MEITLESLSKNSEQYTKRIQQILEERAGLMKQVTELRKEKRQVTDEVRLAEMDFEEAKLVQEISDVTYVYKNNSLTLEQIGLQRDVLEKKIDKQAFADNMVANRKEKATVAKEQELDYCENEVAKCEKAVRFYTLKGDKVNVEKWQKSLENAKEDLEYAKEAIAKDRGKTENQSEQEEQLQEGYSYEEKGHSVKETQQQVLKDREGNEFGDRTIIWNTDLENGRQEIETVGQMENGDDKYSIKETTLGEGDEIISQRKDMTKVDKTTGKKENFAYQKDNRGNEIYYKQVDGKTLFRMHKTPRGTTIENYDGKGQILDSFEYDKDGQALIPMDGMEQLDENYVENYFDSQMPYFEAENRDITKGKDGQKVLESAVHATEKTTRTGTINKEVQNIRNRQQEKAQEQTQEQSKSNEER